MATTTTSNEALKLGEELMVARKRAGLSQKAVADELGIHESTVSRWENGHGYPSVMEWRQVVILLDLDHLSDVRQLPSCCIALAPDQAA